MAKFCSAWKFHLVSAGADFAAQNDSNGVINPYTRADTWTTTAHMVTNKAVWNAHAESCSARPSTGFPHWLKMKSMVSTPRSPVWPMSEDHMDSDILMLVVPEGGGKATQAT